MVHFIRNLKNRFYYSLESIKNRYPCKIIKVQNEYDINKDTIITYQAVTKLNIRQTNLKDLLADQMLVEKFHPTDCIKLGFLSAAEILVKKAKTIEESQEYYKKIVKNMFVKTEEK